MASDEDRGEFENCAFPKNELKISGRSESTSDTSVDIVENKPLLFNPDTDARAEEKGDAAIFVFVIGAPATLGVTERLSWPRWRSAASLELLGIAPLAY